MALFFQLNGDVLHVTEQIYGAHNTKVSHWYIDIVQWKRSLTGKEGEVPTQPMMLCEIEWVQDHHLPKVGITTGAKP